MSDSDRANSGDLLYIIPSPLAAEKPHRPLLPLFPIRPSALAHSPFGLASLPFWPDILNPDLALSAVPPHSRPDPLV
jgi:hypothetical protein